MNTIDYFKQDITVGDAVLIELTSGKSVTGVVMEISDCVIIKKNDGRMMRLLEGIIGGWELKKDSRIGEEDAVPVLLGHIEEEPQGNDSETVSDGSNDSDFDDDEISVDGSRSDLMISLDIPMNEDGFAYYKGLLKKSFIYAIQRISDSPAEIIPTNGYISREMNGNIVAVTDNGRQISIASGSLIGSEITDVIIGKRVFITSPTAKKSKRNILQMTYGQMQNLFCEDVDNCTRGRLAQFVKVLMSFPRQSKKGISDLICKLKLYNQFYTIYSNYNSQSSQSKELYKFIRKYLANNPEANIDTLRTELIQSLKVKLPKSYIKYILVKELSIDTKAVNKSNTSPVGTGSEKEPTIDTDINFLRNALLGYKEVIISSGVQANQEIETNAHALKFSESPNEARLNLVLHDRTFSKSLSDIVLVGD